MIRVRKASSMLASILVLGLAVVGTGAKAQLIYDNGAPNLVNGNEMTQWIQAEDFTLASPVVLTDVRFWDIEGTYHGSLVWQLYANNGGQPGSILDSGSVVPSHVSTGRTTFFGREFVNDFSVGAISLSPGTYWLGLHNGPLATDARSEFYWETTNSNNTSTGKEDRTPFNDNTWFNNSQQHAFQLFANSPNNGVPEPGSVAMFAGMGISGLLFVIRRKKA